MAHENKPILSGIACITRLETIKNRAKGLEQGTSREKHCESMFLAAVFEANCIPQGAKSLRRCIAGGARTDALKQCLAHRPRARTAIHSTATGAPATDCARRSTSK